MNSLDIEHLADHVYSCLHEKSRLQYRFVRKMYVRCIMIDFSRAFDVVDHVTLLGDGSQADGSLAMC